MGNLLFFDIETHKVKNWAELPSNVQVAFENHMWDGDIYEDVEECYNEKAGLSAEFSQVICVSLGYEMNQEFRKVSIYGIDEKELLKGLKNIFDKFYSQDYALAGHNIGGFDIPYLIKRYIINEMHVPKILQSSKQKPWERADVDTMQEWKFGGYNSVSLEVISSVLNIPCKSTEVTGSNMYRLDITEIDWEQLKIYCEEDVESSYRIHTIINRYYNYQ